MSSIHASTPIDLDALERDAKILTFWLSQTRIPNDEMQTVAKLHGLIQRVRELELAATSALESLRFPGADASYGADEAQEALERALGVKG